MATAAMPNGSYSSAPAAATAEVRVWGMDLGEKPFIQPALARHMTEKGGALLTGVLPVKYGDVIGIRYQERKARFKVSWVSDQDSAQTRSVGVDCLEDVNFFGVRKQPIPIEATSTLYTESKILAGEAPPNRRKADRYPCHVAVDVALDNSNAHAHASVTDISRKGCYLQMVSPFAAGSRVTLNVYGSETQSEKKLEPIQLRGIVKTCHPMVGMGVQFEVPRFEQRRKLVELLKRFGSPVDQMNAIWAPAQVETAELEELPLAVEMPSMRELIERVMIETKKLEAESRQSAASTVTDEVRQAAVHLKSALHLCER